MKKLISIAAVLLAVAFLLPSLAFATPAIPPPGITSSHRAPPGMVLSPDLANDNSSLNPQPDLGKPNYNDWAFYDLAGLGGYTGVYTHLYPQPVHFDTSWWSNTQEYWANVVVSYDGHDYAEIGLDVTYEYVWETQVWHTEVYAAYSEDPNGYGTVFQYYDLGYSLNGPTSATVATYQTSGSTWAWTVNNVQFATHQYSQSWQGYIIHSNTEAYNQPAAGTNGPYITLADTINIKPASTGLWSTARYQSGGVSSGWMVNTYATNGYHYDWSTRT
jgi:hypothetical protein